MKEYLINSKPVAKHEFFASLRQDCRKVVSTTAVAGWCGVDICGFDEREYEHTLRSLRKGHTVLFLDAGRTYVTRHCSV